MHDREYLKLSGPAFRGEPLARLGGAVLTVPDEWREAFGQLYEATEDPEVPGDEIIPSFQVYLDSLPVPHPGGETQYRDADGNRCSVEDAVWVWFGVPFSSRFMQPLTGQTFGQTIVTLKAVMNGVFQAAGINWYERWMGEAQLREETTVAEGEG